MVDDKCKAVASSIEELSGEFTTIKFYQVDIRKHAMLSTALSNKELPIVVVVKKGTDILTLTSGVSLTSIWEGLRALSPSTADSNLVKSVYTVASQALSYFPNTYWELVPIWSVPQILGLGDVRAHGNQVIS
jgi:thioredoxin-like negative regulator of GroEL